MSSAVLDRILAIPDYDDRPQMGLSRSGLAAIVERGGLTKDGTKAKASVLERAGIKGDRAINSEPRIVKNNANTKDLIAVKIDGKSVSVPSGSEFVAVKDNHIQSQIVGQRAYRVAPKNGTQDDYIRETAQGQYAPVVTFKTPEQALKYAEKLNRVVAKKQKESPKAVEKPNSRKLTNQPKPVAAAIAPETAKKVKRAIAGVKGGKVNQASLKRNLYQAAVADTIKDYKQKNKWDFPIPTTSTKKTSEGEYAVYTFPTNRDAKLAKDLIAKDYKGIEVKGNTITHPANTSMKNFKKIFTLAKRAK